MPKQATLLPMFTSSKRSRVDNRLTPAEQLSEKEKLRKNLEIKKKLEKSKKNRNSRFKIQQKSDILV